MAKSKKVQSSFNFKGTKSFLFNFRQSESLSECNIKKRLSGLLKINLYSLVIKNEKTLFSKLQKDEQNIFCSCILDRRINIKVGIKVPKNWFMFLSYIIPY